MDVVGARRIVVLHDLHVPHAPIRRLARHLPTDQVLHLDAGSARAPVPPMRLRAALIAAPAARIVLTRFASPAPDRDDDFVIQCVLPIAHPIPRVVADMQGRLRRSGQEATSLAAAMADGRLGTYGGYPRANFQVGFLLGAHQDGVREQPEALAARLASAGVRFGLVDVPATLTLAIHDAFALAGIAPPPPAPESDLDLPARLEAARDSLGRAIFDHLCRKNREDLLMFDAVVELLCADRTVLPKSLRDAVTTSSDAAARLTGHRRSGGALGRTRPATPSAQTVGAARAPASERPASDAADFHRSAEDVGDAGASAKMHVADPVLGWRLAPGHVGNMTSGWGADVALRIDEDGCRTVPGQPGSAPATLALYGCSCVFGWWLPAEDTMAALLQARLGAGWRVENHGVGGYGQTQAVLQLTRDLRFSRSSVVGFGWIDGHLARNVTAIGLVQRQAELAIRRRGSSIVSMPRAVLSEANRIEIRQVGINRPDLLGLDLTDFAPDPALLDVVCATLMRRAAALVRAQGGDFFVLVQMGRPSAALLRMLAADGIPVLDAAVEGAAWMIGEANPHPNAAANKRYADVVEAHVRTLGRHVAETIS